MKFNCRDRLFPLLLLGSLVLLAALDFLPGPASSLWVARAGPALEETPARFLFLVDEKQVELSARERLPRRLLELAAVQLAPGDSVQVNGEPVLLDEPLVGPGPFTLQVRRASLITLLDGDEPSTFLSSAATLGQALAEADVALYAADRLAPPPGASLSATGETIEVTLRRAVPVQIRTREGTVSIRTAAETVGEALAEARVFLQGEDYSQPSASDPLPPGSAIRVVRVQERVEVEQAPLPFETRTELTDQLELDQRETIQPGEPGVLARRFRTRLEDGVEVGRELEEEWVARAPQDKIIGYGSRIVVRTLDTPNGPIEYWRKVQMYATSYSPCRIYKDRCDDYTALGHKLQHGVVAMTNSWCRYTCGDRVYVPGYGVGVVADTGGGVPGRYWIDLGYSESDYVSWHQWVTVYFLAPVPANYQVILP